MGNVSTKEHRPGQGGAPDSGQPSSQTHGTRPGGSRARGRSGRSADLGGLLGISGQSASGSHGTPERRETRQEREARRLERERQARLVERERSLKEEHVDGGYLVTLGTYVGPEDFNKTIVRQLQIERRLAPFWRGLNDFSNTWTEYQLTAAARGLEIPPPDQPPPESFFSRPPTSAGSPPKSATGTHLTVPNAPLGSSPTSQPGAAASPSCPATNAPGAPLAGTSSPAAVPSSPTATGTTTPRGTSSNLPFKPRAKALAAALSIASRNGSSTDITPREIKLPHDPYVNGQPIEVFLYKDADECPICFLSYPPYLNHTRCCGQEICSECFVQIKRADPHYPEGHGDNNNGGENGGAPAEEQQSGHLISEPACCPFCQQPEFGVTYDPPPFRRGLVHSSSSMASGIGAMGAAMSSNSSINSSLSPTAMLSPNNGSPPTTGGGGAVTPVSRRRAQSLSANAPNVITTDKIRPDWSTKLASQSAHIARRAAAATALHTAAFLMGGNNQENRPFRASRFNRRNASSNNVAGDATPNQSGGDGAAEAGDGSSSMEPGPRSSSGLGGVAGPASGRRTRMEDLEELMFREALRQSLATEEERRRKEEKEERKEAKRREKEERKAQKAMAKRQGSSTNVYNTGTDSGQSSASASTLSLPGHSHGLGSGLGLVSRRRGNSGASNLRVEASVANAMAVTGSGSAAGTTSGQGTAASNSPVSSGDTSPVANNNSFSGPASPTQPGGPTAQDSGTTTTTSGGGSGSKGKAVDRSSLASTPETDADTDTPSTSTAASPVVAPSAASAPRSIPITQPSAGPSHLRQMSSASSVESSLPDSAAGSFPNPLHLQDPRASGLSLGSRSGASEDGDHHDDHDPSTSTEPLFNFGSLAAVVGVQIEGKNAGRRLSVIGREERGELAVDSTDADAMTSSSPPKDTDSLAGHVEHAENGDDSSSVSQHATETLASSTKKPTGLKTAGAEFKHTPEVLVTPGTPAAAEEFE
ncbi:SNF1-interacting protein [Sporothrix curviconia]|uniref:SNF1-interacting protein n=1 Tax=Sporothrix curviconia TaxID=1260050 RepID=A0ABP0AYL8_9PEZI